MPFPFDATLKDIVAERPDDFATVFDLPSGEPVQSTNVDLSTISAATDVALAYGDPVHVVVDLNFQAGPDPDLPKRLHIYNAVLHNRYDVPVRSILVLLRSKANAANLTGSLTYGVGGCRVEFGYEVIRIWEQPVEAYLHAGIAALPLSTLCRMPEGQPLEEALKDVVREIERRLARETTHAEAVRLMTAAYILTGLRVKKNDLAAIYRGVGLMSESTAFDEAVEEGEVKGKVELLTQLGTRRFGPPGAETEVELKSVRDLARIARLADAILTAESWQEWLATP